MTSDNAQQTQSKHRGRTGPRTAEGKKRSSYNSMTHGCRAARHCILPGEKQEDFEALRQYWFDVYQPVSMQEAELVTRVVEAEWRNARCQRLLDNAKTMQARMDRYQREAASQLKAARRAYDVAVNGGPSNL